MRETEKPGLIHRAAGLALAAGLAALATGRADAGLVVRDLGTLGGTSSAAFGINDAGQVVGYSGTANNAATHAFLYSGSTMTDLNDLLEPGSGWTITEARAINNHGQIAAYGWNNSTGQYHALLLESGEEILPTPEPSTLAMGSLASLLGLAYTWRHRRHRATA